MREGRGGVGKGDRIDHKKKEEQVLEQNPELDEREPWIKALDKFEKFEELEKEQKPY